MSKLFALLSLLLLIAVVTARDGIRARRNKNQPNDFPESAFMNKISNEDADFWDRELGSKGSNSKGKGKGGKGKGGKGKGGSKSKSGSKGKGKGKGKGGSKSKSKGSRRI
eukprot:CAMPEP_0183291430 /NCGR_PEP_ID=MMETSP0160_2-20130417/864_1 /TAXON_ID=2839 ORGANISM="Odontella Sinensis, Strain Grunow 1884" /NCGR_SAMPLE_ID=MMETSP0160_2 /ASSEMBLY_ACC=CAM_ASM_000250 /LENGTH=109 /DNA_ID=CAMNT_0025452241 /DNA_START=80 /DNA_END=409 /DNA_ORIENTATION=-